MKPTWTPVTDSLPDPDTVVLVRSVEGHLFTAYIEKGFWRLTGDTDQFITATHWTPLPEGPVCEPPTVGTPECITKSWVENGECHHALHCSDCGLVYQRAVTRLPLDPYDAGTFALQWGAHLLSRHTLRAALTPKPCPRCGSTNNAPDSLTAGRITRR